MRSQLDASSRKKNVTCVQDREFTSSNSFCKDDWVPGANDWGAGADVWGEPTDKLAADLCQIPKMMQRNDVCTVLSDLEITADDSCFAVQDKSVNNEDESISEATCRREQPVTDEDPATDDLVERLDNFTLPLQSENIVPEDLAIDDPTQSALYALIGGPHSSTNCDRNCDPSASQLDSFYIAIVEEPAPCEERFDHELQLLKEYSLNERIDVYELTDNLEW